MDQKLNTQYQIGMWEDTPVSEAVDPMSHFRNKWWQKIHRYFREIAEAFNYTNVGMLPL